MQVAGYSETTPRAIAGYTRQPPPQRRRSAAPRLGGVLAFTDRAIEILSRADAAARRFNPDVRVRIVREAGGGVRFDLTDEADPTDRVVEHESGFTLFLPDGLEGTVDVVEPHDQLILRSPGDPERSSRTTP